MKRRLIIRLSNEYLLDYTALVSALFDGDFIKGLVFLAVLQANVGQIDEVAAESRRFGALDTIPPDAVRRPVRPYTLAVSMGLPRERVRRKIAALVAEGWLAETPNGVIAPARVFEQDNIRQSILKNTALVVRLYSALGRAGVEGVAPIKDELAIEQLPNLAISRITMRFWLRSMDEICKLFSGDLLSGLVHVGILSANTAYLNDLPGPPYADLEDHVPDALRRPVTAIALAANLGLPRETIRRHVRALEAMEVCQSVKGGLIVPQAVLRQTNMTGPMLRTFTNIRLMLNQLHSVDFPPESGERHDAPTAACG